MSSSGVESHAAAAGSAAPRERPLRFAMITTFYPPHHFGGDAIHVRRLTHALARRGHRVDIIYDVDAYLSLRPGAEHTPLDEPDGVRVHALRSRLGSLSTLATHQLGRPVVHSRRIRRILAEAQPDVIHYHNISLVGGPGILSLGRGIKIYTAHEYWLVCPTHILWRHGREACTGRECLRCTLNYRRPPQLWRHTGLLERAARHVDAFCSPSPFGARMHREFGFGREPEVLPLFLQDVSDAAARPTEDASAELPYFLFVGRLEEIKGVQELIPLFTDEVQAELLIVGQGEYEPELRRLAEGRPRVRFLGARPPETLRGLYAHAVAVVMPSLCYEVFPLILLESFREGTPVVARRIGPFPEALEGSGAGILFSTPSELRAALLRLLEDPSLRDELGRAGRTAFQERWTEEVVLRGYFALIARIAKERDRGDVVDRLTGVP